MKQETICPKCGRPSWAPYRISIKNFYGKEYLYDVYRHTPHKNAKDRRPTKHNVRVMDAHLIPETPSVSIETAGSPGLSSN